MICLAHTAQAKRFEAAIRDLGMRALQMGWATADFPPFTSSAFSQAASGIGKVCPLSAQGTPVEILRPVSSHEARRGTLSSVHGLSNFPLHTDGAHLVFPPRLIILACMEDFQERPTWVCSADHMISLCTPSIDFLAALFLVSNGRKSFYASAMYRNLWFRWDTACMRPKNRQAQAMYCKMKTDIKSTDGVRIDWVPGRVLAFDNWTHLHGRGLAAQPRGTRKLIRAAIHLQETRGPS
jgi:alpha-ketoglutarate-dependent taurine dioxygenase